MTTKNLIPRASGEGGIGITDVTWGYGYYDTGNFNKGLFVKGSGIEDVIANTVTQGGLGGEWTKAVNGLDIYYNGGNVGIGTTDPGVFKTVFNNDNADTLVKIASGTDKSAGLFFGEDAGSGGTPAWIKRYGSTHAVKSNKVEIGAVGTASWVSIQGDSNDVLNIKGSGNVGIGTTTPATALDINKEIGEASPIITLSRGGVAKSRFAIANATGSILDGALTDDLCIRMEGGNIRLGTASATRTDMSILSNGNVGIGTTDPVGLLQLRSQKLTQLSGSVSLLANNSVVNGTLTDFTNQLKVGDEVLLETVIYNVASIQSDNQFTVTNATPSWGNAPAAGVYRNTARSLMLADEKSGHIGVGFSDTADSTVIPATLTVARLDQNVANAALSVIRGDTSAGDRATAPIFNVFNGEAAGTEVFRVQGNGNVGIGITNPGAKLDILGSFKLNNPGGSTLYPLSNDVYKSGTTNSLKHSTILNTAGWRNASVIESVTGVSAPAGHVSTTGLYLNGTYGSRAFTSASLHVNCNTGNGDFSFLTGTGAAAPTTKLRLQNNGNVGIGTTNPGTNKLYVNGNIFANGTITPTSDDRVKHNEQTIVGAIEILGKLTPKKYIKTTEMYDADHDFELDANGDPVDENGEPVAHAIEAGVIAQKVLEVPELAFTVSPEGVDEDGNVTSPHGLNYNSLFTYAIAAIQEQQQLIEDLKSRIETLENK